MREKANDYPFMEVAKAADDLIRRGMDVYQKWTCDYCGSRQTMPEPNMFWARGICEECKTETDIVARGCNYMVTTPNLRGIIAKVMGDE